MKVYALKYKEEIVGLYRSEYEATSSHRWENDEIKADLKIVTGTFTEDTKEETVNV